MKNATFEGIKPNVLGFFRIGFRFERFPGQSADFGQKWHFEFLTRNRFAWERGMSCLGTRNRLAWDQGTVFRGNEELSLLGNEESSCAGTRNHPTCTPEKN